MILQALSELRPNCNVEVHYNNDGSYTIVRYQHEEPQPPKEEIQAKIKELELAEPMRLLRQERDKRLADTDWWTIRQADGINMTNAQKRYRQALRDLPDVAEPKLDENGNLINVFWPEKP